MYEVDEFHWIQIASMYLQDAAARWFQSVEHKLKFALWGSLLALLCNVLVGNKKKSS
jgi:hypothetical protein